MPARTRYLGYGCPPRALSLCAPRVGALAHRAPQSLWEARAHVINGLRVGPLVNRILAKSRWRRDHGPKGRRQRRHSPRPRRETRARRQGRRPTHPLAASGPQARRQSHHPWPSATLPASYASTATGRRSPLLAHYQMSKRHASKCAVWHHSLQMPERWRPPQRDRIPQSCASTGYTVWGCSC